MLTDLLFVSEVTALAERFNFKPSPIMTARYYDFLADRLNDEQFKAACHKLYATARYFPAPVDFLEALMGRPEDNARLGWAQIMRALKGGGLPDLDATAAAALRDLGGMGYVNSLDWGGLRWAEKDFVTAYRIAWQIQNLGDAALMLGNANMLELSGADDA